MIEARFDFRLSGLLIAIMIISMMSLGFGLVISELQTGLNTTINSSITNYNKTDTLIANVESIKGETDIAGEQGVLDVIGSYFRGGYAALKVSGNSLDLMDDIVDEAAQDVAPVGYFRTLIFAIGLIILVVGIFLAVLLKWRI